MLQRQIEYALAHPVFEPKVQLRAGLAERYGWAADRDVSAVLTCNIGME